MEIQDILTLTQAADEHKLTELKPDDGNIKLSLRKEEASQIVNVTGGGFQDTPARSAADVAAVSAAGAAAAGMPITGMSGGADMAEAATGDISGEGLSGTARIDSGKVVSSPLMGTFYDAATPESGPFVKAGDTVKKGQVMGIIEAMKLMNEIEYEFDGMAEAVLANNKDVVEYGQPLFHIRQ